MQRPEIIILIVALFSSSLSRYTAAATLSGIELMHMIRKGRSRVRGKLRPAQQFYALAA